jgi:hypothetical protein
MTTRNILSKIVLFSAGAAIGSAVTWKLVKTKYERIAQDEIDSVKEYYAERKEQQSQDNESEGEDEPYTPAEEDVEAYNNIIKKCDYNTVSNESKPEIQNEKECEEDMGKKTDKPYVISPEIFAESDNEIISMTYYANGVLVDEFGGEIDKELWAEYVTETFMDHFGDYEYDPDVVYVRNNKFGIDYEILKDLGNYPEDK